MILVKMSLTEDSYLGEPLPTVNNAFPPAFSASSPSIPFSALGSVADQATSCSPQGVLRSVLGDCSSERRSAGIVPP